MADSLGVTFAPGLARWMPLTTTHSSLEALLDHPEGILQWSGLDEPARLADPCLRQTHLPLGQYLPQALVRRAAFAGWAQARPKSPDTRNALVVRKLRTLKVPVNRSARLCKIDFPFVRITGLIRQLDGWRFVPVEGLSVSILGHFLSA
jgi:hypothetical protein